MEERNFYKRQVLHPYLKKLVVIANDFVPLCGGCFPGAVQAALAPTDSVDGSYTSQCTP